MSIIIVAEPNQTTAERLLEAAATCERSELSRVNDLDDALDLVEQREVSVVIIGPSLVDDMAFRLVQHLSSAGITETILVPTEVDADLLRRALRAGAADVVGESEPLSDIAAAVGRAHTSAERARQLSSSGGPCGDGDRGRVVTVFSAKGGVGKTAVATNLAVALASGNGSGNGKHGPKGRVCLVDLDLEFGDVAIVLGLKPRRTIADVVQVFDRLDGDMLEGFLEEHGSGLSVLIAPVRPEEAETISGMQIGQIIDLLRCRFDYVVIDTCPSFSEGVLAALDRSDDIYLVASTDVTAVKNARVAMQKLRQLGYDQNLVRLVLNRADNRLNLPTGEIEEAIGLPVVSRVPSDIVVPKSQNKGVTVVQDAPRSDVAKSIVGMAKTTVEARERSRDVVA